MTSASELRLVVIESPYAGDVERNVAYARRAMSDALHRGEAPIASHLLYTQPGILDDLVPGERSLGIAAGLRWAERGDLTAFYVDLGWSSGMLAARAWCIDRGRPFELRTVGAALTDPLTGH